MDKQKYIDYLTDTSAKVSPLIRNMLQQYAKLDAEIHEGIMFFVNRRLGKPLLKPALLRASYEVCGGENWEKVIPACAAFELINISSYQANSAFDNKLGVLTQKQKETQFIAAMSTREVAYECLGLMRENFDEGTLSKVAESLSVSNKYIYIAQHWDINLLTMANRDRYADSDHFMQEYTKRCYYGSGIFSGQCAYSGALLANASDEELNGLKDFGEKYGTALHMINDLGDYVPASMDDTATRDYQDQFSDFRNGRLTLPLYYLSQRSDEDTRKKMSEFSPKQKMRPEDFVWLTHMMLETNVISDVKNVVAERMDEADAVFEKLSFGRDIGLFKVMTSIAKTNKYYWFLGILQERSVNP